MKRAALFQSLIWQAVSELTISSETDDQTMDSHSDTLADQIEQGLFDSEKSSRSRRVGLIAVLSLLVAGTLTFFILSGLTPIVPTNNVVLAAAIINALLAFVVLYLIYREVRKILRSRRGGRAASRLHVRIVGLFCLVAAFPAILVAIVAGITLDVGLDRWFEIRTKNIIESSVNVARAYKNESTRVLMGNTLSMAADLDRNRQLFVLDRRGFSNLFAIQARGRGFDGAYLLRRDGSEILSAKPESSGELPEVPIKAIERAASGDPVHIPPGNTNYVSAVFKLRNIPDAYLYSVVAVQPEVLNALRETELNSADYQGLEQNRLPYQITFCNPLSWRVPDRAAVGNLDGVQRGRPDRIADQTG